MNFTAIDSGGSQVACSVTVEAPEDPGSGGGDLIDFTKFDLRRAKVNLRGRHAASFWFGGFFSVDLADDNNIDPVGEETVITVNSESTETPMELTIPSGEFRNYGRGRLYKFKGKVGDTLLRVYFIRRGRRDRGLELPRFGGRFPAHI